MKFNTRNHPVVETMLCEISGGDLRSEAATTSIDSAEISLGCRGIVMANA